MEAHIYILNSNPRPLHWRARATSHPRALLPPMATSVDPLLGDEAGPSLTVGTFNIWGIPFASHAYLSRPGRLGDVAAAAVLSDSSPGARTVLCFQEAWAFKTGVGQPCVSLARAFETCWPSRCTATPTRLFNPRHVLSEILRVNSWCTLLASAAAAITTPCFPCTALRDDATKRQLVDSLRLWGLPYAVGQHGDSMATSLPFDPSKLMDSGLLIVSSVAPVASGFVPYASHGVEAVANKGFLWALLPPVDGGPAGARGGQLIVTTHQHADQPSHSTNNDTRSQQRKELCAGVESLRVRYSPALVVLCGDLNETADERPGGGGMYADLTAAPLSMVRLTDCKAEGTCLKDDGSGRVEELDHIFACGEGIGRLKYERVPPLRTPWSDHSLLWVHGIVLPQRASPVAMGGTGKSD